MKKSVMKYFRSAVKKVNEMACFVCMEANALKEDMRGESQNTSMAGGQPDGFLILLFQKLKNPLTTYGTKTKPALRLQSYYSCRSLAWLQCYFVLYSSKYGFISKREPVCSFPCLYWGLRCENAYDPQSLSVARYADRIDRFQTDSSHNGFFYCIGYLLYCC